jgi:DegV family protein with EDD domain
MERIYIVDSQNVTFPEAALDLEAFKMIKAGKGARETAKRVEYLVPRIHMRAFIQDLRYLKIGGRISGVKASIAEFLNFKVVIKTGCNLIEPTDKLRGLPRALRCITDTANSEDIDYSLPSYIGHTNDPELAERLLVETKEETKLNPAKIFSIGPTVGAHVGRGCTGLCWFIK